jgi:hypothetical protein
LVLHKIGSGNETFGWLLKNSMLLTSLHIFLLALCFKNNIIK